jgi:hypothetical protein
VTPERQDALTAADTDDEPAFCEDHANGAGFSLSGRRHKSRHQQSSQSESNKETLMLLHEFFPRIRACALDCFVSSPANEPTRAQISLI